MPQAIPIILWAWVPITLALFRRLSPRRAALACLIGGWLVLPTARFADDAGRSEFPYWIMPSSLPSDAWTTKARVIGVACLLGMMASDPGCWRRVRPSAWDLGIVAWCASPILSGLENDLGWAGVAADSAYLATAWGVPYFAGRVYLGDPAGLDDLADGLVLGGLACLPACTVEFATGPRLYRLLYGFHPYEAPGARRYVGFRPVGFFEDGNQLGAFLATAALVALWTLRSGRPTRLGRRWSAVAALVVGAEAVLAQSVGALILLAVGLAALEACLRAGRLWPIVAPLGLALALLAVRATNLVDAKGLATSTAPGRAAVDLLVRTDRGSVGWRLRVEERGARLALRRPAFGRGTWDWWRPNNERPWGLPGLVVGMYGLAGWAALISAELIPAARFLRLGSPRSWADPNRASAAALLGAWLLNVADSTLNAALILPMLAAAGGLVGLGDHARRASAWLGASAFARPGARP